MAKALITCFCTYTRTLTFDCFTKDGVCGEDDAVVDDGDDVTAKILTSKVISNLSPATPIEIIPKQNL